VLAPLEPTGALPLLPLTVLAPELPPLLLLGLIGPPPPLPGIDLDVLAPELPLLLPTRRGTSIFAGPLVKVLLPDIESRLPIPPPRRSIAELLPLLLTLGGPRSTIAGLPRGVSRGTRITLCFFDGAQPAAGELPLQPLIMLTPELPLLLPFGSAPKIGDLAFGSMLLTVLEPELPCGRIKIPSPGFGIPPGKILKVPSLVFALTPFQPLLPCGGRRT
jgi:hypothetical protein